MARKPRENLTGGIYHVYARGNAGADLYRDDVDRRVYLRMLETAVTVSDWLCLAYCLMGNHVHLLLETPAANLSSGMQRLHSGYAQAFNARHRRSGHVFQGRYGAVRMRSDGQVCVTAAYIARNPVEAGFARRPEDWCWSSFSVGIDSRERPWLRMDRLLWYFGDHRDAAWRRYEEMSNVAPPGASLGSERQHSRGV